LHSFLWEQDVILALDVLRYIPFTRSSKHQADIELTSSKRWANVELARPANILPARRASL